MRSIFFFCLQVHSFCPYRCECASEPRTCDVGVSLMIDGCNCCKVCAKQLGEQCNNFEKICDTHRNLFCDFTISKSGDWGVCKGNNQGLIPISTCWKTYWEHHLTAIEQLYITATLLMRVYCIIIQLFIIILL